MRPRSTTSGPRSAGSPRCGARSRTGRRSVTAGTPRSCYGLVAEVALEHGDVVGARAAVETAFAHATDADERYYEAEICRLRAECALAGSRSAAAVAEARQWLEHAVDVARRQGAGLWEERARVRLATLGTTPAVGRRRGGKTERRPRRSSSA